MTVPLLISVPHAGSKVPSEVAHLNLLTAQQITEDGDTGARDVFDLADEVVAYVSTDIARAYVDVNRAEDDRRSDGVVKTQTIYQIPIYRRPLREDLVHMLLQRYYHPYHRRLSRLPSDVILGIDCHTMAAEAPPISPEAGTARPLICLSNGDGTCSEPWTELMAECLEAEFNHSVSVNSPFRGGYIIRTHARELPWLQLELSRAPFMPLGKQKSALRRALKAWCRKVEGLEGSGKE